MEVAHAGGRSRSERSRQRQVTPFAEHNTAFKSTDERVRDTALFRKATDRKSTPRRRGPAKIPDIDDAGVTVKFPSQTFKAARCPVKKKVDVENAGEVGRNSVPGGSDSRVGAPSGK